jgi:DNA-binding NarL/FixJ family response regulator
MKILIADNHELVLDSLEQIISSNLLATVLFRATNGKQALDIAKYKQPDLIISDYRMEEMNGLELLIAAKKENPTVKFLVVSMVNEPLVIEALVQNGVDGYVNKDCDKWEILKSIKTILGGQSFFCKSTYRIMKSSKLTYNERPYLSKRELEILKLVYAEKKNQEIAVLLGISVSTVETHKKNLIKKLKVKTTVGLIKYVAQNQLFS